MANKKLRERIKELNGKQKKRLKTALVMTLSSVVLLSGATFAWFTISNSVKVNSLRLSVVSEGSLIIADTQADLSSKKTEVEFGTSDAKKLYPSTTKDGITIMKPVYSSSTEVSGVADIAVAEKGNYYYEKEIWLMVEEDSAFDNKYAITLAKNDAGNKGSYVHTKKASPEANQHPEYSIRISFQKDGSPTAVVYEPNSDGTFTGAAGTDYATNSIPGGLKMGEYTTHEQTTTGEFTGETGTVYYEGDSSELFEITGNNATKVTIRVWFEGTDHECMNSIKAEEILGQLCLVSHKKTS